MSSFVEFMQEPSVLTVLGFVAAGLGVAIKLWGGRFKLWLTGKMIEPLTRLIKKLAPTVIAAVNQEFVDELRKAGEWTEARYHEAMELAYVKMQAMLTVTQWNILEKLVNKDEVREFVKSIINETLRELKTTESYVNAKQELMQSTKALVKSTQKPMQLRVSQEPTDFVSEEVMQQSTIEVQE